LHLPSLIGAAYSSSTGCV
ncbi:hypothetical protein A2U01_0060372, partial [Trifolium medium]|nr:hypothetical protein [Trifolium medium]